MPNGIRRNWLLGLVLGLALTVIPSFHRSAFAEGGARTNMDARLRVRPGERAPTIMKLSEGTPVRVIGRQGRWLKVSARGKVGWLTRTQVDMDDGGGDEDEGAPAAREGRASRSRDSSKESLRRKPSKWSSMDEDARGEDAVETESDGEKDETLVAKRAKKDKKDKKDKSSRKDEGRSGGKIEEGATVELVKATPIRQKPSKKSGELYTAEKGERMTVVLVDEEGEWIRVEDADGVKGWVPSDALALAGENDKKVRKPERKQEEAEEEDSSEGEEELAQADDEESGEDDEEDKGDEGEGDEEEGRRARRPSRDEEDEEPAVRKKGKASAGIGGLAFGVTAHVGLLAKSQRFESGGTGPRANYGLSNTVPNVQVGAMVLRPMGKYQAGAEACFQTTVGGKGITVEDPGAQMTETLAWSTKAIDVRAFGGYWVTPKYVVRLGAGYRRAATTVTYSEMARLPSERVTGFPIGAAFEAPTLAPKIGLRVGLETILGAKLVQTAAVADGTSSSMAGYYLNALGSYAWKSNIHAVATYQLAYEGFSFSGQSQRETTVNGATRRDLQHILAVGLTYSF